MSLFIRYVMMLFDRTLHCLIVLPILSSLVLAQTDSPDPTIPIPDVPKLYFDALNFSSEEPGQGRLDVYIEVPYEAIHFTKDNDIFRTAYDITIDVHDSTDKLVIEKFWTEKIETQNYDESISPQAGRVSQKSFTLHPGKYVITVQVTDRDTRNTIHDKRTITVHNFAQSPFAMSDMMLVNRLDTLAGKKVISPNISGNVADLNAGFFVFFELYNRIGADSARVMIDVRNVKGDVVQSDTSVGQVGAERKSTFIRVKDDKLVAGDYMLDASVEPLHTMSGTSVAGIKASTSRSFIIHWRGLPVSIVDLDLAIDQLQYMTDKEKIDEMKNAPPEKKRDMFREFWKKRDPTPNTERNELMEEYYARVVYANKHFSHYLDGWKTDMGMVYIIFGTPSNVERHPFDIDAKPYEVWTYYEQNREFVFVDATGFGDYRLQNPIWDLWRTRPH
ncbi:MAG: GWxTD domain-containing protein [Ignavibacteriae bacterium]|nr:GWxTD domain-containing protein [Ignavibacteria bacterium]MBI3363612.1 GWxTD domain-containing protein [Ignavibacteriota bacterium]